MISTSPQDSMKRVGLPQLQAALMDFVGERRASSVVASVRGHLSRNGGGNGAIHVGQAHGALHVRQANNEVRIEKTGESVKVRAVPVGSLRSASLHAASGQVEFDGHFADVPSSYRLQETDKGIRADRGLVLKETNPTAENHRDLPVVHVDRDSGSVTVDGAQVYPLVSDAVK